MLFSFRDVKTEKFGVLFEAVTFEDAVRSFCTLLKSGSNSLICQYPDDFILYHIGEFDIDSGLLRPLDSPVRVISGLEVSKILYSQSVFDGKGEENESR